MGAGARGDVHQVDILRLDVEGDGLAEIGGRPVRVPFVLPGERVEVRLPSRPRDEAELVRVLVPSPHRVAAPCRHFGPCGGCAWQHIAYPEQLRLKQAQVQRLLAASLGRAAPDVLPTLATPPDDAGSSAAAGEPREETEAPAPWHYRDKVHFVFGPGSRGRSLEMGHYRRGSRSVVPVVECPVHAEVGNRVAFELRDALLHARVPGVPGDAAEGIARHAIVRVAEEGRQWLATLVVTENAKPLRGVTARFLRAAERAAPASTTGFFLNVHDRPGPYLFGRETRHLAGARAVRERIAGITYHISPTSFFQTNVRAARLLVGEVLDALADGSYRRVLDLYAGVGLFALPLARAGRIVTAVEENREASAAAAASARENQVGEASFRVLASAIEAVMGRLTPHAPADAWDAVVLDPPRVGCPPVVLDWLCRGLRPRRIVYVSCNPEALAADLRQAGGAGYRIRQVRPVDMFPHTAHIESVAVLDALDGGVVPAGAGLRARTQ
jgi:23S rRNA (uracil1939-C5)-methyltransferase